MFIANFIWVSSGLSVASMQLFSSKFFAFVLWYFVAVFAWEGKRMKRGGSPACIISIPHLLLIIFWFSRFDCCFCCLQLQLQSMQIQNRQKRRRKVLTKFRPKNALTNIHTYIQTCIHMYVCILYIDRNTNTDAQFSWLPFMHFHSPAAVALALSVSFAFSLPPTHLVSQPLGTFRTPLPPPLSTFLLPHISLYSCVCVCVYMWVAISLL